MDTFGRYFLLQHLVTLGTAEIIFHEEGLVDDDVASVKKFELFFFQSLYLGKQTEYMLLDLTDLTNS